MPSLEAIAEFEEQLLTARAEAERYFGELEPGAYDLPPGFAERARELSARFHAPLVRLVSLVRESAMLTAVDLNALQLAVRRIDAALRLRLYEEWGPEVLHDEDIVLAVKPAGFSEDRHTHPRQALEELNDAVDQVSRRIGILRAEAEAEASGQAPRVRGAPRPTLGIEPGTAFIIMMIDPERPELEDVKQAIQEEFARFGIRATRSDDIEHSEEITQRILDAIMTSEFLIADLTGERPSVYYEVGYAHAIGKRPILYRRAGTRLHFDLAVHNCPEYRNVTELRERLRRRLTAMTGGE